MNKKLLLGIFIFAAAIRIWFIWKAPLWYDENFTLLVSRLPFDRMFSAILGDVHPPLHYLITWPLIQLLPSAPPWIIRLPSLVFSVLALWVFWRVLQEMATSPRVRTAALLLLAIAPIQIIYAQEGRMYALLELLVLCAYLAMLKKKWIWFWLATTAALYTQNYGVFYAACLWAAGMLMRLDWRKLTLSLAAACLAWLPWIFVMAGQMGLIQGTYWIPSVTPGSSLYAIYQMFFPGTFAPKSEFLSMLVYWGWMCFVFYHMTVLYIFWRRFWLPLLVMAFGTWLLAILVSAAWQPVLLYRPLVGSTPFLYLLLAQPVPWVLISSRRILYAGVFILPLLVVHAISFYGYNSMAKIKDSGVMSAFTYIEQNWQPGDIVYHVCDSSWINTEPYWTIPVDRIYKMPECGLSLGRLSDRTRAALGYQVASLTDLDFERAWIITAQTPLNPACEQDALQPWIAGKAPINCFSDDKYVKACLYLVER